MRLTHLGAFVRASYNPGMLTALILFLPASFWVAKVCFGKCGLPYEELAFIVADGALLHVFLIGSTLLFLRSAIGRAALTGIQILDAILFFVLARITEKRRSDMRVRSAGMR